MSKVSPTMDTFCECANRGFPTRMKKTINQKMGSGETGYKMTEKITWTCPVCGYSKVQLDTHGTAVNQLDYNMLTS